MDPRIGMVVAERYRVIERLAQGGMGAVYRGEHIELAREVAVKFLHEWAAAEPAFVKRFEIEARAMAKLAHANCAQVLDVGVAAGAPLVVMELVSGRTLMDVIDDGPVPALRAIEIMRQILAALDHAHSHGVIHRDIKPANIAVATSEFGDQVKVLDFGLAKIVASAGGALTGAFAVGTPTYISPEQSLGREVDARTDLYAAGVVLYELLTGAPPFLRDEPADVIAAHRTEPPPPLGVRYSSELGAVVERALAKAPDDRFATATDMARALAAVPEATEGRAAMMTPLPMPRPRVDDGTMVLGSEAMIPIEAPTPSAHADARAPSSAAPAGAPSSRTRSDATPLARLRARIEQLEPRQWWWIVGGAALVVLVLVIVLVGSGGDEAKRAPTAALSPSPPAAPVRGDSPALAELRPRLRGADTADADMRALGRLATREPGNAEIPLALGQIYCERLWVSDCLEQFRKAIQLDPALREDPRLLRSAVYGLGADGAYGDVQRFLLRDIGAPAVAALDEVLAGRWRKEVKDRAAATRRDLAP